MQTWAITYKNEEFVHNIKTYFYNKTRAKINQFDILTYLERISIPKNLWTVFHGKYGSD